MKKAQALPQAGSNVAIFVILLALFLAVYILLLPPEDRERLLTENYTESETNEISDNVKLEINSINLEVINEDNIIKNIDSINLYSKDEPKITDLASSLYLEKSLTSETKRNLMFEIDDLENLDKINLVLIAVESKGNLIVNLNGIIIHDNKINGLANIILPKDLIQKTNNMEFSVSSPGLNIFGKNIYRLSDIKIRENYELTNTRESREFMINNQEVKDVELNYFLYCNDQNPGSRLRIFLNNKEIKNDVISCTTAGRRIDIDEDDIKTGINSIIFQIDSGDYIFSDIKLKYRTNPEDAYNYKFPITEDEFDDILSEDREAILLMEFNDNDKKRATININGKEFSLDTDDVSYERDISRLVKEGNNFIKIIPIEEFNIDTLKITLK